MPSRMTTMRWLTALISLSTVACGMARDDAPGVEPLSQRQSAFSTNWTYWRWVTGFHYSSAGIGTGSGRTCFLSGYGGNLRPHYANPAGGGISGGEDNIDYKLWVESAAGEHMIVDARCVDSSAGRVQANYWTSTQQAMQGDMIIEPYTGHERCFLIDVENWAWPIQDDAGAVTGYGEAFGDAQDQDEVRVFNDGSFWRLRVKAAAHPYPVSFDASAVCLAVNAFEATKSASAGDQGTTEVALTDTSGATCGLMGIRGVFRAAQGDWTDGVFIRQAGDQFFLDVRNNKTGWASCIR